MSTPTESTVAALAMYGIHPLPYGEHVRRDPASLYLIEGEYFDRRPEHYERKERFLSLYYA